MEVTLFSLFCGIRVSLNDVYVFVIVKNSK